MFTQFKSLARQMKFQHHARVIQFFLQAITGCLEYRQRDPAPDSDGQRAPSHRPYGAVKPLLDRSRRLPQDRDCFPTIPGVRCAGDWIALSPISSDCPSPFAGMSCMSHDLPSLMRSLTEPVLMSPSARSNTMMWFTRWGVSQTSSIHGDSSSLAAAHSLTPATLL